MADGDTQTQKSTRAQKEEELLRFWQDACIFEKSLAQTKDGEPFIFYEGPPTANGRPGIHHLEARAFKDIIPRFRTMQGYFVRRKGGWDTHGLPVELQVEKELGLKSKKDIEEYGIAEFNKKCRESVWTYVDEWKRFTDRTAVWLDLENPYVTYEPNYIESVWHIIKEIHNKGLLYKDYKVVPWCPRCGTALSSHELAQGYETVKDLSVTVKFKVKNENTYLLSWTTTPWTLPGNVALAVGENIDYVKVQSGDEVYIVAKELQGALFDDSDVEVIKEMKGSDLIGMVYEPLYDFLSEKKDIENLKNAWKVYPADFVSTEEGTGIVHTAVMYGADDFELGTKVGLPKHHLVNEDGTFTQQAGFLSGAFVRDEDTAVAIIKDLAERELLLKKEKYEHTYPHCWRCKTPLIYYARDSWYIKMSQFRDELVKENADINWEPAHIRDGRFGEWLREIKDWAISRERYWGTPLPVWKRADTNEYIALGSVDDLKKHTKRSGNTYHIMRHGESAYNARNILNADPDVDNPVTETGEKEVSGSISGLAGQRIDLIFYSPLQRTRQTAEMVAKKLGIASSNVIEEGRLVEVRFGEFESKSVDAYHAFFEHGRERLTKRPEGGENWIEVKRRVSDFLYEIERTYCDKNILIISHNGVLQTLQAGAYGYTHDVFGEYIHSDTLDLKTAEVRVLDFVPLPHNDDHELDLHRPYIDELPLEYDGVALKRTPEVLDVWFDSGAMPYAQDHYPFENTDILRPEKGLFKTQKGYPADYISEAIDQTRGWFYTLHALGVLMGYGKAYKNVICLGHILDANGKKMSKSQGNAIDPWEMMEKYGADALRFWMYSVNQPGESKNFDERTVDEVVKKVFNLLLNTLRFYEMYADEKVAGSTNSTHVLDRWICSRLSELNANATQNLERYDVLRPARDIKDFIADLSQWYLRRSRDRFKNEHERAEAVATLRYVLNTLSRIMAPFVPFVAEEVYQSVKTETDPESVHLAQWPKTDEPDSEALAHMKKTRELVSQALEKRAEVGLKIRQPLATLSINEELPEAYRTLIADEVNVKMITIDVDMESPVMLDTNITPELKKEGQLRELIRTIQDLRKKSGLEPNQKARLSVLTDANGKAFVDTFTEELKAQTLLAEIEHTSAIEKGVTYTVDDMQFTLSLSAS